MQTSQPKVSLCMIVKNEEANLPACLESVKGLFDEIIIVDTGSTDRSKEIALQYGAIVSDFEWIDDFSAARNKSLDLATGQWIFWLDADHRVDRENYHRLKLLFEGLRDEKIVYMIYERVHLPSSTFPSYNASPRLFRNHPQLRWSYRVHEQLIPSLKKLDYRLRSTDIIIQHTGYENALECQKKIERDYSILVKESREVNLNRDLIPHVYFELSRHYREIKQPAEALSLLKHALSTAPTNDAQYNSLFLELMRVYRDLNQWENALYACKQAQALMPNSGQLLYEESKILEKLGQMDKAIERLQDLCLLHRNLDPHDDPTLVDIAHYNLAIYFRKQNKLKEAEPHLLSVIAHNPKISLAWQELMRIYTSQMRWEEAFHICQQAKTQIPDDISAYFWESWIQLQLGNYSQAQILLLQLLEDYPSLKNNNSGIDLATIHHNLAVSYQQQADDNQAEKHWTLALKENPKFDISWIGLVNLWVKHGQWDKLTQAIAYLETIVHYEAMAIVIKAKLLAAQGGSPKALSLLREFIITHPEMTWPKIILGEISINASQELAYAEQVLLEVLAMDPSNIVAKQLLSKMPR